MTGGKVLGLRAATLLVVLIVAATALAVRLAPGEDPVTVFWPTAGFSVMLLAGLRPGLRSWVPATVVVAAAVALGQELAGRGGSVASAVAVSQAVDALVAALVLRADPRDLRTPRDLRLTTVEDFLRLLLASTVAAVVAGGVASAWISALAADAPWSGLEVFRAVATAYAAATLVLVPLVLARRFHRSAGSSEELALQVVALLGALAYVFAPGQDLPVAFAPLAVLVWGALRFDTLTIAGEVAVVAVVAAATTREGWGPIGNARAEGTISELTATTLTQVLLVSTVVVALPLVLTAQQRRYLLRRLSSDEQRFRRSFAQSAVGQVLLRREGEALVISDINAAAVDLLGLAREQLVATRIDQHLRGRALTAAIAGAVAGRGGGHRIQADVAARTARVDVALSKVSGPGEPDLFSAQLLDATAEYDARRRLEQAEKLTSTTLDTTACIVLVTDLDGRIVRVNAATTEITGYAASELVGRPVWKTTLAPSDAADLEALFLWPNRSGTPVVRENDVVVRDGSRRRIVWTSNMVRDELGLPAYAVMTGIDVTTERAAAGLVTHLMQASITTALVGVDAAGLITVFNSGAQRLLDFEASEQIGRPFTGLFDPVQLLERTGTDDLDVAFRKLTTELREDGELPHRDWTWIDRAGRQHAVSMSLSVADPLGGTGGGTLLCVARDVTEQRRSQELLVAALEKERTAVERLRVLDDAKSDFVSTVSHELRTPVTSILGYTEMLLDGSMGEPDPDQRPLLETIRRNGERLIDLCNDLLTLSGLDSGSVQWKAEEVDLGRLLRDVAGTIAPLLKGRDLHFDVETPAAPVVVAGDGAQLERVLDNLLSNAVKFTEDGGLVRAEVSSDGESAIIKVRDTGIGIPLEEQDRLFQRFYRSSTAQRQAIQGTGLGLSIVQSIVASHGGTVRVRSAHQEGSSFTVTIPLARS
ncbi:hypothetical protein GCM10022215_01210 [Nocardioides fonticola]|uniref:Sensor-like histidine kinase SenX3 n=1 Tax=Nocardioides fonticola TaxID=450363 RepID=A0ABP7XAA9_9ACTN